MKHKTFFWFVLPSSLAMLLFIFLPLVSIIIQSVFVAPDQVIITVENCGPFGCTESTMIDQEATAALRQGKPFGQFAGATTYLDRGHLAVKEVGAAWDTAVNWRDFGAQMLNLPFYKAMAFTLTYTFVVTPLVIFFSLLPMMITPHVGALILFWMVDARGIVGAALQYLAGDPTLSIKASTPLMWIMLIVYGVWHSAPFAFIVYYAGLQTVNSDTLEAAQIDGASRAQRIRYVVIPHMARLCATLIMASGSKAT